MHLCLLMSILSFFFLIIRSTIDCNHNTKQQSILLLSLYIEVMYKFFFRISIKNLAICSNRLIFATIFFILKIYQVDRKKRIASLVAKIFVAIRLLGIAKIKNDIFYIIAAIIRATLFISTAKNFLMWKIDMNTFKLNKLLNKVEKVLDIP